MQNIIPQFFMFPALGSLGVLIAAIFSIAMIVMHITFAVCISKDTARLREQNRLVVVLTPFVWGLAALVLGLIAVAFYWLCHYSKFSRLDKSHDAA
jgi:cell division protein FtsX